MSNKHEFQTEITQLLDLMINSLYSHKEIFLRELISNSSDAIDKLYHLKLTDPKLKDLDFDGEIDISFDADKKKIVISDNGIGMDEADIIENLGTIAHSGTKSFIEGLKDSKNTNLIGQFGVGFYSVFMVAQKVVINTKKIGQDKAYAWISDGKSGYEIEECKKDAVGTEITIYLKDEDASYANRYELQSIVKKYSSHIAYKIFLDYDENITEKVKDENGDVIKDKDGKDMEESKEVHKHEQINEAKALWLESKSKLSDEDYKGFYKSLSGDYEDPLVWVHTKVEGTLEYTTLFYVPKNAPMDLYRVDYKSGVKLYVKRVFITDDDKELLPSYLRFIRGIIDSEDLPLNVSREILQQNKILATIRSSSTKKILDTIASIKDYDAFYEQFGKVLKEGVMDFENKERILELLRFYSVKLDKLISLKDYVASFTEGQKEIFYLCGSDLSVLKASPLLEGYHAKGIDVLLLADEVDSFITPMLSEYKEHKFSDISSLSAPDEGISDAQKEDFKGFLDTTKELLGARVKEVRLSSKLTSSPAVLLVDEQSAMMQKLMAQMGGMGMNMPKSEPILEINPTHPLILKLKDKSKEDMSMSVEMIYASAKLLEGGKIDDMKGFANNIYSLLEKM